MPIDENQPLGNEAVNPAAGAWKDLAGEVEAASADAARNLVELTASTAGEVKPTVQADIVTDGLPTMVVKFGESEVECYDLGDQPFSCRIIVDGKETTIGEALANASEYQKKGKVTARQATAEEIVSTRQDGMENTAKQGDWIIQNPGEDPYVFGDQTKTVEERQDAFSKKYEATDEPGVFQAKGKIKAIKVDKNVSMLTSWGERMSTPEGGWIADGGYTIAPESFDSTYAPVNTPES